MKVWVLQIRESGEEDMVFLFDSQEKAEQSAYRQLWDYAEWRVGYDKVDELPDSLDELGKLVEDNEWGFYNIYVSEVK